ncbi:uncharacterized protein BJ171DRAFT_578184 [Polychytrium aggregatum]|uniref:uncharacterized protein n=1 Tax=Polychytrium aggregatum TaxID=110093 RepID=UPI0022FF2E20|nr:uncharacterized protein BJ171DRAFT_578184 [Polychytrium aggregatum]KAI9208385.1 hypothetical protein BJ171DRAFT_578184 [Polychytrium aggregatum]
MLDDIASLPPSSAAMSFGRPAADPAPSPSLRSCLVLLLSLLPAPAALGAALPDLPQSSTVSPFLPTEASTLLLPNSAAFTSSPVPDPSVSTTMSASMSSIMSSAVSPSNPSLLLTDSANLPSPTSLSVAYTLLASPTDALPPTSVPILRRLITRHSSITTSDGPLVPAPAPTATTTTTVLVRDLAPTTSPSSVSPTTTVGLGLEHIQDNSSPGPVPTTTTSSSPVPTFSQRSAQSQAILAPTAKPPTPASTSPLNDSSSAPAQVPHTQKNTAPSAESEADSSTVYIKIALGVVASCIFLGVALIMGKRFQSTEPFWVQSSASPPPSIHDSSRRPSSRSSPSAASLTPPSKAYRASTDIEMGKLSATKQSIRSLDNQRSAPTVRSIMIQPPASSSASPVVVAASHNDKTLQPRPHKANMVRFSLEEPERPSRSSGNYSYGHSSAGRSDNDNGIPTLAFTKMSWSLPRSPSAPPVSAIGRSISPAPSDLTMASIDTSGSRDSLLRPLPRHSLDQANRLPASPKLPPLNHPATTPFLPVDSIASRDASVRARPKGRGHSRNSSVRLAGMDHPSNMPVLVVSDHSNALNPSVLSLKLEEVAQHMDR